MKALNFETVLHYFTIKYSVDGTNWLDYNNGNDINTEMLSTDAAGTQYIINLTPF